jgi:hypothetical protein
MPTSVKSQNRHLVDTLADIRVQLKQLEADERACKEAILASGDYVGDDHIAVPKTSSRRNLDRSLLEDKFGKEAVASCCKEVSFVTLNIFTKADIIPAK